MKVLITGSLGNIGSAAVRYYLNEACEVVGIDNDMRKHFFGSEASVAKNKIDHSNYTHMGCDMASKEVEAVFQSWKPDVIIHAGAQTSEEWSIQNPLTDLGINAMSTLMLLEMTKKHTPEAIFVFLANTDDIESSPMQISKWTAELHTLLYARQYGLTTGIFKCKNVVSRASVKKEVNDESIHAKDCVRMIDRFVREPMPGASYSVDRQVLSNPFFERYQNFKFQYNEWAIMEDLKK